MSDNRGTWWLIKRMVFNKKTMMKLLLVSALFLFIGGVPGLLIYLAAVVLLLLGFALWIRPAVKQGEEVDIP